MLASLVIVFREVFEMSIVICVVLAAAKELSSRFRWVFLGVLFGIIGAFAFAGLTSFFTLLAEGTNEKIPSIVMLFISALLIAYTVLWMKKHGRELTQNLKRVGSDVVAGTRPLWMLTVVVGIAVLREGSEIVLFLYGLHASGNSSWLSIISGGIGGVAIGVLTGTLMYLGLLRIPMKHMFSVTSLLLTFIAAGMVANAVRKLVQIDALPGLINPLWDTSHILSTHSTVGKLFAVLIGYQDKPSAMALIWYLGTLGIILLIPKCISLIKSYSSRTQKVVEL